MIINNQYAFLVQPYTPPVLVINLSNKLDQEFYKTNHKKIDKKYRKAVQVKFNWRAEAVCLKLIMLMETTDTKLGD